ncbi:MAG TPA: TonB-dependent receptor [Terracidiphilus sp.]|nr:TonB-dependent receptor [Terracidiphilus sp.]
MKKILLVCAALLVSSAALRAQVANNTSLVGNVLDPSGSVVPGATVTAVEEATRVKSTVTTNAQGYYAVTFIQPGTYDITVTAQGFTTMTKTGVIVPIDQAVRTDFSLAVGSTASTVMVTASTPPMSTDDATLGETFSTRAVENLPVPGHNAMDLAAQASNVFIGPKTSYSGNPPGEDLDGAGQREIQNSISLDGVSILNDLITTTPAHPASDAVAEVQMQSGNYPAQYGGYLGVHVNMVTKSGTNQLHGSAYDYVENTALNAYPFVKPISNGAVGPEPVLHQNQWGGTVGGPVYIPKLYNGRDKTFFFATFEKLNEIGQGSSTASVLTPAMESGDFSAFSQQLYDPENGGAAVTAANGYPGFNMFKPSELSSISKAYEAYMVAPNQAGTVTSTGVSNNLTNAYPQDLIIKQSLGRVDENIGQNDKLFVRYFWQNLTFVSGTNFPADASNGPTNQRNYAIGYTHIFSPTLINDLHVGVNKLIAENLDYWYTAGLTDAGTKLGIPGFTGDTKYGNPGVPVLSITSYQGVGNAGANWFQDDRGYDLYDELSYTRGKHQFMAGVQIHRLTLGREATNDPLGQITFSAGSGSAIGVSSTGSAAADFVLGYINSDTTPIDTLKGSVEEWRDGFFALDNWQVSSKLTLNYGLRYDLPLGATSLNGYGRMLNAAQTALIPTSSATSGATYTPTPGFQFTPAQKDNIGPRLGVDYRFNDKLVFRAGMGFYYNPNQLNSYTLLTSNYPFAAAVSYNTTNANPMTWSNTTPGAGSAAPVAGVPGTYVTAYTPEVNMPTQRSYQWNGDVGYSVWKNAAFEAQYLGSRSIHLDRSYYDNEPTDPVSTNVKSINANRPNQLFGVIRVFQEDEFSTYHALNLILRQREFHGISGQLGYTWSHYLDESTDSNNGGTTSQQYNPLADYANSNLDVRNRFIAVFTYAMPTLTGANLLTRETLGGWHVSGIVNIQSGMPFNVSMASASAAAGVSEGTERPSWVHKESAHCSLKSAYSKFDTAGTSCIDETAYQPAVNYSTGAVGYGNIHRDSLPGPGFQYENLAIFKDFPLYERLTFQFRSEAYNVFNHPSGANPSSGSIGINTSGACATNACLTFPSGYGEITGVQQVPGTFQGARVLELSGKIIF